MRRRNANACQFSGHHTHATGNTMICGRHTILISLLTHAIFMAASTYAGSVSLKVQANRNHIYLGESMVLTVKASKKEVT